MNENTIFRYLCDLFTYSQKLNEVGKKKYLPQKKKKNYGDIFFLFFFPSTSFNFSDYLERSHKYMTIFLLPHTSIFQLVEFVMFDFPVSLMCVVVVCVFDDRYGFVDLEERNMHFFLNIVIVISIILIK